MEPKGTVRFGLLGGFTVSVDGRQVPREAFGRRKAVSLLKLLALQPGQRAHRDRVLAALWPDLDVEAGSSQLYKAIHQMRRALAAGAGPGSGSGAGLRYRDHLLSLVAPGGVESDLESFLALARRALAGDEMSLLEEAAGAGGELLPEDLYEEWTQADRREVEAALVEVLLRLGTRRLAAGRHEEAAAAFRRVVDADPLHEEANLGLLRSLAPAGGPGRFRAQLDAYRSALARDGLPAPEGLERLAAGTWAGARTPPLAGREAEMAALGAALERLRRGRGGSILVEGGAGIGKTRLLAEVIGRARGLGFEAHGGAAHEHEGSFPYAPFIEALRSSLAADPAGADLLPAELAAAIPELPDGQAGPTGPAGRAIPDALAARHALFAAVARFLSFRAGRRPVVLALDDLHDADSGTLALLHYLAREADRRPLLLIGAWRTGEPAPPLGLERLAAELERRALARRLRLAPLSLPALTALLAHVGDEPVAGMAARIHAVSGGNPLFAREIAYQLVAAGPVAAGPGPAPGPLPLPASVEVIVESRLAALSPDAVGAVRLASVVGGRVELRLVEEVAGRPLLEPLEHALRARLLEETDEGFSFLHPLFQEAVYRGIGPHRRRLLHREVAARLEARAGAGGAGPVEALAHHLLAAGEAEAAGRRLVQAGEQAEAVYAHEDALRHFERARELVADPAERSRVSERVGDVRRLVGEAAPSVAAYQAALRETAAEDRERLFELHRKIVLASVLSVDLGTAAEHLALARETMPDAPGAEARLLVAEALYLWHCNDLQAAAAAGRGALLVAEAAGATREASQACEVLALTCIPLGRVDEALRYERRRWLSDWSPEIAVAVDGHLCLFQLRAHAADRSAEEAFVAQLAGHAATVGNQRCLAICNYAAGSLALRGGDLAAAESLLASALEQNRRIGSAAGEAYTLARQAELLTAQGRYDAGREQARQGLEAAARASIRDHCVQTVQAAAIRNRVAAGDLDGARAMAAEAEAQDDEAGPCFVCRVELYATLAELRVATGDLDAGRGWSDRARALAELAGARPGLERAREAGDRVDAAAGRFREGAG